MSVPSDRRAVTVDVLRVFCDSREEHGNPLGVVLDGAAIPDAGDRQELAAELGYSETVFIDDTETGVLRIYTPTQELALAGHPLVGAAWLLGDRGALPPQLLPTAGPVSCGRTAQGAWVEADPAAAPYWELRELAEPDEVDALDPSSFGDDAHAYVWCWLDEPAGRVRARAFAAGKGIVEDEATGSAAMVLGALTGRILTIEQGRGSVIQVVPGAAGLVRIGGRVVIDEQFTVLF